MARPWFALARFETVVSKRLGPLTLVWTRIAKMRGPGYQLHARRRHTPLTGYVTPSPWLSPTPFPAGLAPTIPAMEEVSRELFLMCVDYCMQ